MAGGGSRGPVVADSVCYAVRVVDRLRRAVRLAARGTLAGLAFLVFGAAFAQQGNLKLSSGGAAMLTGAAGGAVTVQSSVDGALATVLTIGDVGPNNVNQYVCFTQPVRLRAKTPSTVRLAITAQTFGAPPQIQAADIGVGFVNLRPNGPNTDVTTTSTTVSPAFGTDPCAAPRSTDGIPTYSATLANVATGAPGTPVIVSTGPISLRGSLNSNSNSAGIDLKLAIAPQAFRAGAFSLRLTLTLSSP